MKFRLKDPLKAQLDPREFQLSAKRFDDLLKMLEELVVVKIDDRKDYEGSGFIERLRCTITQRRDKGPEALEKAQKLLRSYGFEPDE